MLAMVDRSRLTMGGEGKGSRGAEVQVAVGLVASDRPEEGPPLSPSLFFPQSPRWLRRDWATIDHRHRLARR